MLIIRVFANLKGSAGSASRICWNKSVPRSICGRRIIANLIKVGMQICLSIAIQLPMNGI